MRYLPGVPPIARQFPCHAFDLNLISVENTNPQVYLSCHEMRDYHRAVNSRGGSLVRGNNKCTTTFGGARKSYVGYDSIAPSALLQLRFQFLGDYPEWR